MDELGNFNKKKKYDNISKDEDEDNSDNDNDNDDVSRPSSSYPKKTKGILKTSK